MPTTTDQYWLGSVAPDATTASNERVTIRIPTRHRHRALRNTFVSITDAVSPNVVFLGRMLGGPFFPEAAETAEGDILAEVEIQGEIEGAQSRDTSNRPAPGSAVHELAPAATREMLGLDGDMAVGWVAGRADLPVGLLSRSKSVLPRNIGIFGTVGAGKSNTVQVLVEEASAAGWAVVVLDLEAEYVDMDQPTQEGHLTARLARAGREPKGLADFHVLHPVSCPGDRTDSQPFTLRAADFEPGVVTELLQATLAERNALLECIDHFVQKFAAELPTRDPERTRGLLDPSPTAQLPYTLYTLRSRAYERSGRNSESMDFVGLASKLQVLLHSGVFDQPKTQGLDPATMVQPGRVTALDVSTANDTVKNLVTADLLRKVFAYKLANEAAPPALLVIEEAHSFMSRDKVQTMQATLQMLRNVARRGRKRWLGLAFVSQQPGHLPAEIFELCNTRLVHTLRSTHNLDALMATTGDVTRELWAHCPLLGTGQAILSTPQLRRSVVIEVRPATSSRRFVR